MNRISPYERGPVVQLMIELQTWRGGPVAATLLADHLGKSDRMARLYLRRLEVAGLVQRPAGPRSGWLAV